MSSLYNNLATLPQYFLDVTLLGRFIENQDNPRFAGLTNDTGLRQSAFVFNILGDGIPIVPLPPDTLFGSKLTGRYITDKKII